MANRLGKFFAGATQGLLSGALTGAKIEELQRETDLRQKNFEIDKKKFEIIERETAMKRLNALGQRYSGLSATDPKAGGEFLKLQDTQNNILELSKQLKQSPDQTLFDIKFEGARFDTEKKTSTNLWKGLANSIKPAAPGLATSVDEFADSISGSKSKDELEELYKQNREIINTAANFQYKNITQGGLTPPQFANIPGARLLKPGEKAQPGELTAPIRGSDKVAAFGSKESKVSASDSEALRKEIAQSFGIGETSLKFITPKSPKYKYLADVDMIREQAEEFMQQGESRANAKSKANEAYRSQLQKIDSALLPIEKQDPKGMKEFLTKKYGVTSLKELPLSQKLLVIQELQGANNGAQGQ